MHVDLDCKKNKNLLNLVVLKSKILSLLTKAEQEVSRGHKNVTN